MNYVNFAGLCRFYALGDSSDSTNLPDATLLLLSNVAKDDIAKEIAKANEDFFGAVFTKNLEANRREYAMPDDILNNLKTVEAKLDGTNISRLIPFDLNSFKRPTGEMDIRNDFASKAPAYDIYRRAIQLYTGDAIIAVTAGLILRAIIYPADFTAFSSSDDMSVDPGIYTFGFPRQFHELLARRVSMMYKSSQDRPKALTDNERLFEADLAKAIAAISNPNLDANVEASVPYDDGSDY